MNSKSSNASFIIELSGMCINFNKLCELRFDKLHSPPWTVTSDQDSNNVPLKIESSSVHWEQNIAFTMLEKPGFLEKKSSGTSNNPRTKLFRKEFSRRPNWEHNSWVTHVGRQLFEIPTFKCAQTSFFQC